jgi:acyl dehydratase
VTGTLGCFSPSFLDAGNSRQRRGREQSAGVGCARIQATIDPEENPMDNSRPRGKYYEELAIGQKIFTPSRTVTEADVVGFAGLSGDFNQIHIDARYAAQGPFGQRVAHGLLVLSIISGLAVQTGFMDRTVIAFREIADWKFSRPVFFGDTVRGEMEVAGLKPFPRLGGGAVDIAITVKNQKDESVMSGTWVILLLSRPAA